MLPTAILAEPGPGASSALWTLWTLVRSLGLIAFVLVGHTALAGLRSCSSRSGFSVLAGSWS
jgi:hypothetical protein